MEQPQKSIRETVRLIADIATALLVAILIGTFTMIQGHDRDIARLDANQRIIMGSVEGMANAVSEMNKRLAGAEATIKAMNENR